MKEVINMSNNDQEFLVQKIRTQYTEKQHTGLDELKALDAKVKKPANTFGYTYGCVSAIVMGAGMSLVMTDIGRVVGLASAMVPGIAIGVVGLGMALSTYPIYKRILNSRKKKYAPEIMALSEKIMNG
jgi:orotate phosphoribosyltransferase-like protein